MELSKLKLLLGISDESKDPLLTFVAEDVEQLIRDYCNIDQIPPGLETTALKMAVDLYRGEKPGQDSGPVMVSSISEGNTSTSFSSTSELMKDTILKNYQGQLNRYRKLRW